MSDQDTSIFGNQQTQVTPVDQNTSGVTPTTQSNDDLVTLLASIKNERGEQKYRTIPEALKALGHSQTYIPELSQKVTQQEQELKEAREAASRVTELERVVQSLTEAKPQTETPSKGLSEDQVAELVARTLNKKEQENVARANVETVVSTVRKVFGDKADEAFYGRAEELGMTKDQFNALAASTPKAVLKLLGIDEKVATFSRTPSTTINTAGFEPRQETFIQRNNKPTQVGATHSDLLEETRNARKMVDELHSQGKYVSDFTTYAEYVKHFKNKQG